MAEDGQVEAVNLFRVQLIETLISPEVIDAQPRTLVFFRERKMWRR